MMKPCNKFKIEEFQLSEELEAVLRKGHRWRLGLVWVIFLTNVLWFGYLALCWSMDWQVDIKSQWSMWPLMLFLCAVDLYAIRQRFNLSQADFARLIEIDRATLNRWEHGKVRPNQSSMAKIAEFRTMGKKEFARRMAQTKATIWK